MTLLSDNKIWVTDEELIEQLSDRGFGEETEEKILLAPEEALFLKEKRKEFPVENEDSEELSFEDLMKAFTKQDEEFPRKYVVYRDLRSRGFVVKTGFKFGSHYRVYKRGVKPGEGHAIWLVHSIPEEYDCSFQELSRAVRLAQNVRKKMIYALVDKEGDVTYYKVERFKP